ncbi:MAG TPA: sodium:solute symporter [Vicinamibacterales bacterium]|nr:sodium:solute symporter [Vicinamibacterales bacterium]
MHLLDWAVIIAYIAWLVSDGIKRTKLDRTPESYFLANRSMPWWAVGLSVMATQLSAVTLVGTTGQGYTDGLRFVQFYYGLPLAMVILCATLVPFFYRAKVYTAYEYLERRFDLKTRAFTSFLFLLSRGMSCGAIAAAPAVVLSVILGWSVTMTTLLILVPAVIYTMLGGVQAVTWTDVKTMSLTILVLVVAMVFLVMGLPSGVGVDDALAIAGGTGRLQAFDFDFTLTETYTFWSGMLGGLFLMLSYFGCDQSQVQRYLTAKSVDDGRTSLLMSAYWKIPLQVLVLLVGVFTFLFYLFNQPPLLFNPIHDERVRASAAAPAYVELQAEFQDAFQARRRAAVDIASARNTGDVREQARATDAFNGHDAALRGVRTRAAALVKQTTGDASYNDVNYVFPTWIVTALPIGIVGLWIAAIITAATDSIAAELNSLSTASVIDFYKRLAQPEATDEHYLLVSKVTTGFWGIFAGVVAVYASSLGSLIEVVNRFGSFFYGSILGVFMLAILTRRATGTGAFVGLIAGMIAVAAVAFGRPDISFLWHNVIGAAVVFTVGLTLSSFLQEIKRVGDN